MVGTEKYAQKSTDHCRPPPPPSKRRRFSSPSRKHEKNKSNQDNARILQDIQFWRATFTLANTWVLIKKHKITITIHRRKSQAKFAKFVNKKINPTRAPRSYNNTAHILSTLHFVEAEVEKFLFWNEDSRRKIDSFTQPQQLKWIDQ